MISNNVGAVTHLAGSQYHNAYQSIIFAAVPQSECQFGCSPIVFKLSLNSGHSFVGGLELADAHAVSAAYNTTVGSGGGAAGASVQTSEVGYFMFETLSSPTNCFGSGFGYACDSATSTTGFTSIYSAEPSSHTGSSPPPAPTSVFMSAYNITAHPAGTTIAPMSTQGIGWSEILLSTAALAPVYSCNTITSISQIVDGSTTFTSQATNGSSIISTLTADSSTVVTNLVTDGTSSTISTDGSSVGGGTTTTTVYSNVTSIFTASIVTTTTTIDDTITTYIVTNATVTDTTITNDYEWFVACTTSVNGSSITLTSTITTGSINPNDQANTLYALLIILLMLAFASIVLVRRAGYLGGGNSGGRYIG
jgi:hypothetical protein